MHRCKAAKQHNNLAQVTLHVATGPLQVDKGPLQVSNDSKAAGNDRKTTGNIRKTTGNAPLQASNDRKTTNNVADKNTDWYILKAGVKGRNTLKIYLVDSKVNFDGNNRGNYQLFIVY